jgi:DNA-directed RNA polymerase sigma subunit (sigma70/sigma32)
MPQRPLTRVRQAAERAHRAESDYREARERLRDEIVAAREAGETLNAIAEAAGVSRQRILQIIKRR